MIVMEVEYGRRAALVVGRSSEHCLYRGRALLLCNHSSTLAMRASLIPLFDFLFQTSIFFHAVSLRCLGLVPPMSLEGGVVGGVIGSLGGLEILESSVKLALSLPLEKWLVDL